MARRLTVHKVIKSVLDPSYDHESGIEDPSLSLPIGIPYSNDETRSPPRKREFTTRTFPSFAKPDCYARSKSGQLPLSVSFWVPPEVGWAISTSSTTKGMNLITYVGHA